MSGIDLSAGNVTAASLLGIVVLLVITGRLVPWWQPKERFKDYERQIQTLEKAVEYWRVTAQKANDAALMQAQAQIEQLEVARTQDHFIRSLQFTASQKGQLDAIPELSEAAQDDA